MAENPPEGDFEMEKIFEQQDRFMSFRRELAEVLAKYDVPESDDVCDAFGNLMDVCEKIIAPDFHEWNKVEQEACKK